MRRRFVIVMMLFLAAASAQAGILGYFRDRGADFLDLFLLRISAPRGIRGIGFRARATALAQVGAIYFEGEHFGMDRRAIGVWGEKRAQGGLSLLFFTSVENDVIWGNYFLEENTPWMNFEERGLVRNDICWDDGRKDFFSVNAEVQLAFLPGLEAGVYPIELIDFVMGFFTLDPKNDDLERIMKYAPEYTRKPEPPSEEMEELPEKVDNLLDKTQPLPEAPLEQMEIKSFNEMPPEESKTGAPEIK